MSDEMVQEKTETAGGPTLPEGSNGEHAPGDPTAAPVSSQVADAPATHEPAPAQPAAPPATAPAPSEPEAVEANDTASSAESDAAAFDAAMQALDMSSQYDRSLRQLQQDTVITGTVMRVDREGVLVDVGAKSEGIIRLNELSRDAAANVNPESIVQVGDKIKVYVLEAENQDGIPVLSKKRADFEQAWEKVQQSKQNNETIFAMVQDRVKGGLVVDLGIRGFVPASHVGTGSLKNNLDKYVGQSIPLKVIEVDKERRKVVLSNKLAVMEERESKSQETKSSLQPNQVRRGIVRRLTNYGAFIDLGGIDGLLHISEMSWTRINDPKEILREGQELDVLVLKMDLENNRVSLGLRQILPDPWTEIAGRYKEGDVITGTVTRLVPFGAFVQVEGGVEGIIPNAELPRNRPKGAPGVNVNEEVQVKVIGLKPDERKMTLSLRALQPVEEREPAPPREAREPREGAPPRDGAGTGGGREGGEGRGGKRGGRGGGEREEREDYSRYTSGRQEEPRFNQLAEAFSSAERKRNKRERRNQNEEYDEEFDDESLLEDEPEAEPEAETEEEK